MNTEFTIHSGYNLNESSLGWWLDKSLIQLKKKVHNHKFQKCFTNSLDQEKPNGTYVSTIDVLSMLKLSDKKYPSWFEKASKKLSRVSWIKFSSEVALYFTRKINQMMQDIHISLILLTLFPLGFLWSVSQGSSAWSTWRMPMPNIIPP